MAETKQAKQTVSAQRRNVSGDREWQHPEQVQPPQLPEARRRRLPGDAGLRTWELAASPMPEMLETEGSE